MTIRLELKPVELTSYGTLSSFLPIYDESSLAIFSLAVSSWPFILSSQQLLIGLDS